MSRPWLFPVRCGPRAFKDGRREAEVISGDQHPPIAACDRGAPRPLAGRTCCPPALFLERLSSLDALPADNGGAIRVRHARWRGAVPILWHTHPLVGPPQEVIPAPPPLGYSSSSSEPRSCCLGFSVIPPRSVGHRRVPVDRASPLTVGTSIPEHRRGSFFVIVEIQERPARVQCSTACGVAHQEHRVTHHVSTMRTGR